MVRSFQLNWAGCVGGGGYDDDDLLNLLVEI